MSGRRTCRALALVGALLAGAVPAAQAASPAAERAADEVFQDYATDGRIDPCRHPTKTLELARDNVTPDVEQYASEYPDAIEAAIAARARGACGGGNSSSDPSPQAGTGAPAATPSPTATTPAPAQTPTPQAGAPTETVVPVPPAPPGDAAAAPTPAGEDRGLERAASAQPDSGAPLPLVALGAVLVVAMLMTLLLLAARRMGIGDERLAPAGHAWREAQWRWQGAWDDFRDWVARGR